jgi:hypothetical protein
LPPLSFFSFFRNGARRGRRPSRQRERKKAAEIAALQSGGCRRYLSFLSFAMARGADGGRLGEEKERKRRKSPHSKVAIPTAFFCDGIMPVLLSKPP